jgi:alkylhydroperoxidase family enzyme
MAALSALTRALIEHRGHLDEPAVAAFTAAGFTTAQLFEVITGVAISTMTNHTANVARPPLEAAVLPHEWTAGYSSGV